MIVGIQGKKKKKKNDRRRRRGKTGPL